MHFKFYFIIKNQNCCLWAIAKGDLGEENPKVFALPYTYEGFKFITSEDLDAIKAHFPKKPFAIRHWLQGAEFYGGATDSIVVLDGGEQLVYASSSESSFEAMDDFLKDIGEEM